MNPNTNNQIQTACIPRDIMMQAAMIRLGDVSKEIQSGYNILRKYHKTVTIFGSARMKQDDPYYQQAKDLAQRLAENHYAVVSGGGMGIMSAANEGANEAVQRGAKAAGGSSIGFNIKLPHEQTLNSYVTESYEFAHFAPRKIVMTLFADAYVFFPGGFGTIDELSEILTLIQTGKTARAPIILVGSRFWNKFDSFVEENLLDKGYIQKDDLDLYVISDDLDEVMKIVIENQTYCRDDTATIQSALSERNSAVNEAT